MRIALVGDAGSINVRRWAEGLTSAGAEVHVFSFVEAPSASFPVHRLHALRGVGRRASYVLAGRQIRRAISTLDPTVVVGYYATGYGTIARLARRHPLVQVVAGNDVLVNPPGTLTHAIARRNLREADVVVAWSRPLAIAAEAFGVPPQRIVVLPRGIPLDLFSQPEGGARDPHSLVVSRALEAFYRHDVLIRAVSELEGLDLKLTFVGSGPARRHLEELARSLGLDDRVGFVGSVANDDLPAILRDHAIYLSACPSDGLSASLLEAMAAGLFPIVSDHPANGEWITHGENGLLVKGGASEFASAIRYVASHPSLLGAAATRNAALLRDRADLSRNSAKFVESFSRLAPGQLPRGASQQDG